jgi:hypothetical protein
MIFHTLKGIIGWSSLSISKIDICKIKKIYYKKRLFCIFDRDHPYNLIIIYNEPTPTIGFAPGFDLFDGDCTFSIVESVSLTVNITKRYKTEIEVKNEIEEIQMKQNKLKLFLNKFESNINKLD